MDLGNSLCNFIFNVYLLLCIKNVKAKFCTMNNMPGKTLPIKDSSTFFRGDFGCSVDVCH